MLLFPLYYDNVASVCLRCGITYSSFVVRCGTFILRIRTINTHFSWFILHFKETEQSQEQWGMDEDNLFNIFTAPGYLCFESWVTLINGSP